MIATKSSLLHETRDLLSQFGVKETAYSNGELTARTPITGEVIAHLVKTDAAAANNALALSQKAFLQWRSVPALRRGELVRLLGEVLRANMSTLGRLVTIETGKILSEAIA